MPHRYFTTEIADGTAVLRGTDAHHLARVMRARMGDTVILCDGSAVEYTATITRLGADCVAFSVEPGYPSAAEPSLDVNPPAGSPKHDKLDAARTAGAGQARGYQTCARQKRTAAKIVLLDHVIPSCVFHDFPRSPFCCDGSALSAIRRRLRRLLAVADCLPLETICFAKFPVRGLE